MLFNCNNRGGGQINVLSSALTVPAGSASGMQYSAITGSVYDLSGNLGTAGGAFASLFQAIEGADNETVWPINWVCTDQDWDGATTLSGVGRIAIQLGAGATALPVGSAVGSQIMQFLFTPSTGSSELHGNMQMLPAFGAHTAGTMRFAEQSGDPINLQLFGGGHFLSAGTAPSASACGTGPAVTSNSTDTQGEVTTGTSAAGCKVSFANGYGQLANCVVTPEFPAATATMYMSAKDTSSFTLTFSAKVSSVKFTYVCMANS